MFPSDEPSTSPSSVPTQACLPGQSGKVAVAECSAFQTCTSGFLELGVQPCASGLSFSEVDQTCKLSYTVWCEGKPPSGEPLCPNNAIPSFMMAVDNCSGYRSCLNGKLITGVTKCADGHLFDESIQTCLKANLVECVPEAIAP